MLWKKIPKVFGKYEMSEKGVIRNKRTGNIIKLKYSKKDDGSYLASYFLRINKNARVFHLRYLFLHVFEKDVNIDKNFIDEVLKHYESEKTKANALKYQNKKNIGELLGKMKIEKTKHSDSIESPENDPFAFYSFENTDWIKDY
jgi:hypothetical protein